VNGPGEGPDLVLVGKVGRPHGLQGAFFVEGASEDPRRFARGAALLVAGVPVKVLEAKQGAGGRRVLTVDGPAPRGAPIEVPRADLPPPAEGEFYVFQLIGVPVVEDGGRPLGAVREVLPGLANDVLELDTGVLLPLVDACVLDVDLAAGRITVARGFAAED
jgi:16S rRNA processing protein RimM